MAEQPRPLLFYDDVSPPVRSVLLTMAALNINDKIDLKLVSLFKAAHREEAFVKINPLHTVPVLQHGDLTLTDSHAIVVYLCDIFADQGGQFSLEDPLHRAKVLNRLCFNNAVFFARDADLMRKIFQRHMTDISDQLQPIEEAYGYLELYLQQTRFVACDKLTIADFSIVATLSTLEIVYPVEKARWPRIHEWHHEMKQLPYFHDANQAGADKIRVKLNAILKL